MRAFISGVSSGLGMALSKILVDRNFTVYGIGRNPGIDQIHFNRCDLAQLDSIEQHVSSLIGDDAPLDLVLLNAGVIMPMSGMTECSLVEIKKVMDVNVWANKIILDCLLRRSVGQVIAISSGAAVNGSKGWSSYSLSKATLNMLIQLYASEFPKTHFTALAPGLVSTPMLNGILDNEPTEQFPSLERLHQSEKQSPQLAAERILKLLDTLKEHPSGGFLDVRKLIGENAF